MKKYVSIILFSISFSQIDTVITVDASSYFNWVYFSFDTGSIVPVDEPENSLEWDLAFKRNEREYYNHLLLPIHPSGPLH